MMQKDYRLGEVVSDVVDFIDEEQERCGSIRSNAVSNVLFEWQAYYSHELPDYVQEYRDLVAQRLLKRKVNDNPRVRKFRARGDNSHLVSVSEKELKDRMDEEIKDVLYKMGELVQ